MVVWRVLSGGVGRIHGTGSISGTVHPSGSGPQAEWSLGVKYYLHRISHHMEWSYPLLEGRCLLSIGWADFGSRPDFVPQHQDDWSKVSRTIEGKWGKVRPRFGLQRFLEMEQGDRVVVPTWGAFHVYNVADNVRLVPAQIEEDLKDLKSWQDMGAVIREGYIEEYDEKGTRVDLGFFRRVEPLARDIPRDGYADAAFTSRMKVRQTNVEITDLRCSVENAIGRYEEKRPINLRRLVLDRCASEVRNTILAMQTPEQFEKLIALYFERQGASTVIPRKNESDKEGDADIVATFESLKLIVYVQAKRHDGETDKWAVEQIQCYIENQSGNGADDEFTRMPWVISTSETFSEDCRDQAKRAGVRLIDGMEFARMLLDTGIEQL